MKKLYIFTFFLILSLPCFAEINGILNLTSGIVTITAPLNETQIQVSTEYVTNIDSSGKTTINAILELQNNGNQSYQNPYISPSIQLFKRTKLRTIECKNFSTIMGDNSSFDKALLIDENNYNLIYTIGIDSLNPREKASVINRFYCQGFLKKVQDGTEFDWEFINLHKSGDMIVRVEIEKPLFYQVNIVRRYPLDSQVTDSSNKVTIEWYTKSDTLDTSFTYDSEFDIELILTLVIGAIIGLIIEGIFKPIYRLFNITSKFVRKKVIIK